MPELTQKRLKELLDYDPETGVFRWRLNKSRQAKAGMVAGHVDTAGYVRITIGQKRHQAHRLAWLYMNGVWPEKFLDHADCNRANNAFRNLREATNSQNRMNARPAPNKTGYKGVWSRKDRKGFQAVIKINGRQKIVGYCKTPEEAHEIYVREAQRHFGEFARAK